MYWVEIQGNKITGKGEAPALSEGQKEVSKAIYNQLTRLPADFEMDGEGNITSVTPAPEPEPEPPEPSEIEVLSDYILELDYRLILLELGVN